MKFKSHAAFHFSVTEEMLENPVQPTDGPAPSLSHHNQLHPKTLLFPLTVIGANCGIMSQRTVDNKLGSDNKERSFSDTQLSRYLLYYFLWPQDKTSFLN